MGKLFRPAFAAPVLIALLLGGASALAASSLPIPTNVRAVVTDGGVLVEWEAADGLGGFNVYRNSAYEHTADDPQGRSWTDPDGEAGDEYFVTSFNVAKDDYSDASVSAQASGDENPGNDPGDSDDDDADPATTTAPDGASGQWRSTWSDEFDEVEGAAPGSDWDLGPNWAAGPREGTHAWRDAVTDPGECFHDGDGSLVLRTRRVQDENRVCYVESKDRAFGPGENGAFIEFRANVSDMKAMASWFAMWLMTPGKNADGIDHAYDGNPATGTEVDVMEFVPFEGPNYTLNDKFHVANFWGDELGNAGGGQSEPPLNLPFTDEYGQTTGSAFGSDLRDDKFHTWGVESYDDRQIFYFDGEPFWTNTEGVSTAETHQLRLSIEIANGAPYNIWGHAVGAFEDNPAGNLPSQVLVDYVRVYERVAG